MPEYRITISFKIGEPRTGIRHHPKYDMEIVRPFFEKKVYEVYSKFLVESIKIERIQEPGVEVAPGV